MKMERKTEYHVDENEIFTKKTITTVNPEDGFVPKNKIDTDNPYNYGKYQMGKSKSYHYSTNDPKIVIPTIIAFITILQIITILMIVIGIKHGALKNPSLLVFGFIIITFDVCFTIAMIKEIKKIKEKFKKDK